MLISHWFDGLAHLHRFDIVAADQGQVKVFYSSRRQCDNFVKYVQETGNFGDAISFGQKVDPCVGIFSKVMSCFRALDQAAQAQKYDNMNVTVQPAFDVAGLSSTSDPLQNGKKTHDEAGGGHRGAAGKNIWIATDGAGFRTLDESTLEPLGPTASVQSSLHPSLKGAMSCAHAQRCPVTGDLFNFNLQGGPTATYRIFHVSAATGKTDILATISRSDVPTAYIHSFFLSERFVVLRVPSSHFSGRTGLSVPWKGNLVEALVPFNEKLKSRWFVIDRVHGRGLVGEFETPAAFFFHSVNCWDEAVPSRESHVGEFADVYCDVVDFPTMDIIHKHYYDVLMNVNGEAQKWHGDNTRTKNSIPSLIRWKFRVPLPTASSPSITSQAPETAGIAKPEVVFTIPGPHIGELPTINPNFHTKRHRYMYSLPLTGKSTFVETIIKTDTITREVLQWSNPAGHTPAEAIFVPRPGGTDEDDGVLLSVVLDGHLGKSYLVCLDAQTMEEAGRADMDFVVGIGLHGIHSPA